MKRVAASLAVLIAACSADTARPHSPSEPEAIVGYDEAEDRQTEECSAVTWSNEGPRVANCERQVLPTTEPWTCDCDASDPHEGVATGECRQALTDECGSAADDFDSCTFHEFGTCVPGIDNGWNCACDGDTEPGSSTAGSCEEAVWAHCATAACSAELGSCEPGTQRGEYRCYCEYYDRFRTVFNDSCDEALERICQPGVGLCNGFQGYCDEIPSKGGYSCYCLDGTLGSRTYEQLGTDDCGLALGEVCGTELPDDAACEVQVDPNTRARCEKDITTDTYSCTCTRTDVNQTSASGTDVTADDCASALAEACSP